MSRFLAIVTFVAVALWLGSLVHTLLSVSAIFHEYPKAHSDVAVKAAPVIFDITERTNLVLAGVAIAGAAALVFSTLARPIRWTVGLLVAAGILACVQTFLITARMDALRLAGEGGGETFKMLHGLSSGQYLAQTLLLLAATVILGWTAGARRKA